MKLTTKLSHEVIKQLEDSVFVGRIATQDEIARNTFFESPIEIKEKSNHVSFHIVCLSEIPNQISRYFTKTYPIITGNSFTPQNERIFNDKIQFNRLNFFEVKPKVEDMFKNKTVLFMVKYKNHHLNVELLKIEPILPSESYATIPIPDLKLSETGEDLKAKIITDKRPISLKKYPSIFSPPELLIYENTIYKVDLQSKSNPTTYFQQDSSDVSIVTTDFDYIEKMVDIVYDNHLYFLTSEHYEQIQNLLKNIGKERVVTAETQLSERTAIRPTNQGLQPNNERLSKNINSISVSEIKFLKSIIDIARYKYKMHYEDQDIYSFHISVKTNPLTILGGMSGTGKSQLARIYGEALGLIEGETMLFLPISPSYQDPNDILGFFNPNSNTFHERETGLVSLLMEAEKKPEQLYMVIFDEMNLSQVEHWLSPFLSLLEIRGTKHLRLFHDGIKEANGKYPAKLALGDNLIFIGTVNFDETTKSFSDRLLDRTNIISLQKVPFYKTIELNPNITSAQTHEWEQHTLLTKDLREDWKYNPEHIVLHLLTNHEIFILDQLHEIIHEMDPQKGVSFRVALAIVEFMMNVPTDSNNIPILTREKLFDYQITQRILTKINGIDSFVAPLVGQIIDGTYEEGKLATLFLSDKAQKVSDFKLSIQTLKNKAKELMMYGFTN